MRLPQELIQPEGRERLRTMAGVRQISGADVRPVRLPPVEYQPEVEAFCQVIEVGGTGLLKLRRILNPNLGLALLLWMAGINPLIRKYQRGGVASVFVYSEGGLVHQIGEFEAERWQISAHIPGAKHWRWEIGHQNHVLSLLTSEIPIYPKFLEQMHALAPSLYTVWEAEARAPVPVAPAAKCRLSDLI